MPTPYLNLTQVAPGQNNKEQTINADLLALERATQGQLVVSLVAGDVTLTPAQFTRFMTFTAQGAPSVRTITVPNNVGSGANTAHRLFIVYNPNVDYDVNVTIVGGNTIVVPRGTGVLISSNGTQLVAAMRSAGAAGRSIGMFLPGTPEPVSLMMTYIAAGTGFTLPAGLTNSRGRCGLPPIADAEFIIARNAVPVGSVLFAADASTATFSLASSQVFAPGDFLSIISPSETGEIEDVSITLITE